ncbi:DUF2357 domain-containing protein [Companilactobacillus zhongbaensis]|uniref:DUF2357 domain-containing protein n=1 Tax=Companilactobacillus zhongbaensis TaxID=2486009 RepID=UPI000F797A06|nr:DUF2357 domain-containing protein [Companilactobacillus zhongbaensis]
MDTPFKVIVNDEEIKNHNNLSPYDPRYYLKPIKESDNLTIKFLPGESISTIYLDDFSQYAHLYSDVNEHMTFVNDNASFSSRNHEQTITIHDNTPRGIQLTPQRYQFRVVCNGITYYYSVNVTFKDKEFEKKRNKMLNFLLSYFSREILTKNPIFETVYNQNDNFHEDDSHQWDSLQLILQDAAQLQSVLTELNTSPKVQIKKDYHRASNGNPGKKDQKSIELTIKRRRNTNQQFFLNKEQDYNITANRYAKFMLKKIDKFLQNQISDYTVILEKSDENVSQEQRASIEQVLINIKSVHNLIQKKLNEGIFHKVESVNPKGPEKTITQNPVYKFIRQKYYSLKNINFTTSLRQMENNAWRQTDVIYELWSYFYLIEMFLNETDFKLSNFGGKKDEWKKDCFYKIAEMDQKNGNYAKQRQNVLETCLSNDDIKLNIVYQMDFRKSVESDAPNRPLKNFYQENPTDPKKINHYNPDIFIEILSDKRNVVGGIVLDSKYKPLTNCVYHFDNKENNDVIKLWTYRYSVKCPKIKLLNSIVSVHALLPGIQRSDVDSRKSKNEKEDGEEERKQEKVNKAVNEKVSLLKQSDIYFDIFNYADTNGNDIKESPGVQLIKKLNQEIHDRVQSAKITNNVVYEK